MALTEYEKAQFEKLTADFKVEDVSALKQMKKQDKATTMTFFRLPLLSSICLAFSIMSLVFMIANRATGHDSAMFLWGGIGMTFIFLSALADMKRKRAEPTADTV